MSIDVGLCLQRARKEQLGYLTAEDVDGLARAPEGRLVQVLVRCGRCRYMCAAQDVAFLHDAISRAGDYVRDYSLPVHESQQSAITQAADLCVARLNEIVARINVTFPNGGMQAWINGAHDAIQMYTARRFA